MKELALYLFFLFAFAALLATLVWLLGGFS